MTNFFTQPLLIPMTPTENCKAYYISYERRTGNTLDTLVAIKKEDWIHSEGINPLDWYKEVRPNMIKDEEIIKRLFPNSEFAFRTVSRNSILINDLELLLQELKQEII